MAKSTHILLAEQLAIQSLAKERRIAFQGMGKFGPDARASEQSFRIDADVRVSQSPEFRRPILDALI
jgi:hypothetical protein